MTGNTVDILTTTSTAYAGATNITIKPSTSNGYVYKLKSFEFGIIDQTSGTQSVENLMNSNETIYGTYANSTIFNMGYKGLGLPTAEYNHFTNLINVATGGEAQCFENVAGFCILPGNCSSYANLWAYRFKIQFDNTNKLGKQSLLLPLATFGEDQMSNESPYGQFISSQQICNINVQHLDSNQNNSKAIILGSMFYQNVYMNVSMNQTSPSSTITNLTLAINVNAMVNDPNGGPATGAYITSQVFT